MARVLDRQIAREARRAKRLRRAAFRHPGVVMGRDLTEEEMDKFLTAFAKGRRREGVQLAPIPLESMRFG